MTGPFIDPGASGFDPRQTALDGELNETGHPINAVFGGARVIAKAGMRPHHHQHVWEAFDEDAEIGLRPVFP